MRVSVAQKAIVPMMSFVQVTKSSLTPVMKTTSASRTTVTPTTMSVRDPMSLKLVLASWASSALHYQLLSCSSS